MTYIVIVAVLLTSICLIGSALVWGLSAICHFILVLVSPESITPDVRQDTGRVASEHGKPCGGEPPIEWR
jgi:hypothetical protein